MIRKVTFIAAILILTACNTADRQLKYNAQKYINAMAEYQPAKAYDVATPETQHVTLDYISKNILPYLDSNVIESNTPAKIHLDSIRRTSDTTATVYYRKTTPIQYNTKATLDMRLRDGQWLVHQVIQPAPLIGGSFSAIDTAALREDVSYKDSALSKLPHKIVQLDKK